jgi:hypothetical protein
MTGAPENVSRHKLTQDDLIYEIGERINEVNADASWFEEDLLPNDDPHIARFLEVPTERRLFQSRIGYCFQPLIKHIYETLGDDLAFIILMYSPEQLTPNVSMKDLKFCAFNNKDLKPASQLTFRKIFRFIGTNRFSRVSIQTSKILFEKNGWKSKSEGNCRPYIYSFEEGPVRPGPEGIQIIPVGALLQRVLDSSYFKDLHKFVANGAPENIWDELSKQFKRFYHDGDLEKWVLGQRDPTIVQDTTGQSLPIDGKSLFAFEHLLETFGLRSSKNLRRRFLNYLTWMLLCDETTKSYSYVGALDQDLPRGELVIASRQVADLDLAVEAKNIVMNGFRKIFESQKPWLDRRPKRINRFNSSKRRAVEPKVEGGPVTRIGLSTLNDERLGVDRYINSSEWSGPDPSAEVRAISGLDETLLNYVGPILTNTFLSPHEQLSLDPFWSENIKKGNEQFPQYIADLTHSALAEEFSLYQRNLDAFQRAIDGKLLYQFKQPSRVNPFLMAMSPIADYLTKEMTRIREAAIHSSVTQDLNLANRSLGEIPLDPSGLLSLNVVFWDIATSRFRYCSLSFINGDEVFAYAFSKFFRLIETVRNQDLEQPEGRGILENVLLMSDVLFRTPKGKIEPVCIVFEDQQTFPEGTNMFPLSVSEYIRYLDDEHVHAAFNKMYVEILREKDVAKQQKIFTSFCSDKKAHHGVWDFLRNGQGKYKSNELEDRTTAFLQRYGVEPINRETVAHFLAYITWLWLCYRERPVYYYYIPAQLPFDERVGGFAIASETPIPTEIVDFLFVSVGPRIVSYPALLHHREADTKLSRALLQCWFDSLLHIISNSYGLKELGQDLGTMDSRLVELQESCTPEMKTKFEEFRAIIKDARWQMEKIPDLEADLKRIFGEHSSTDTPLKLSEVLTLSLRFSRRFVQKREINISRNEISPENDQFEVHSPLVLVLWHLILNASKAIGDLPSGIERKLEISIEIDAKSEQATISVTNDCLLATVDRVKKERWKGLKKDENVLKALWHKASPGMRPEKVLAVRITPCNDGKLAQVEVSFNAPAIPIGSVRNPRAIRG